MVGIPLVSLEPKVYHFTTLIRTSPPPPTPYDNCCLLSEYGYGHKVYSVLLSAVFGNESGGNVEVCLFPWSKETLPTAEDVVNLFRFNPEIVAHCEMWEDADIYTGCGEEDQDVVDNRTGGRFIIESYGDDKTKAITFVKWLDENGTWPDSC